MIYLIGQKYVDLIAMKIQSVLENKIQIKERTTYLSYLTIKNILKSKQNDDKNIFLLLIDQFNQKDIIEIKKLIDENRQNENIKFATISFNGKKIDDVMSIDTENVSLICDEISKLNKELVMND